MSQQKSNEEIVDLLPYHRENTNGVASNIKYYTRENLLKALAQKDAEVAKTQNVPKSLWILYWKKQKTSNPNQP